MPSFASKPFFMDTYDMILVWGYQLGGLSPVSLHDVIPRKGRQWLADHHLDEKTNITSQLAKTSKIPDLFIFQIGGGPHHGGGGGGQLFVGSRSLHQVCRLWSCLRTDCSHSHQEIQVCLLQKTLIYCSRSIIMIQPGCLDLWFKFVTFFAIQTNPLFFYEDIDI